MVGVGVGQPRGHMVPWSEVARGPGGAKETALWREPP